MDQQKEEVCLSTPPELLKNGLVTTLQLAAYLQVCVSTLEKQRSLTPNSHPPYIKFGRSVRYNVVAVQRWLGEQKTASKNNLI